MTLFHKKPDVYEAVKVLPQSMGSDPYTFEEAPDWLRQAIFDGKIVAKLNGDAEYYYDVLVGRSPVYTEQAFAGQYIMLNPNRTLDVVGSDYLEVQYEAVTS